MKNDYYSIARRWVAPSDLPMSIERSDVMWPPVICPQREVRF